MASFASLATNFGTLAGCFFMPWIAHWFGSRKTVAVVFFAASLICNVLAYYSCSSEWTIWIFPDHCASVGILTNGVFALFTVWLPELFSAPRAGPAWVSHLVSAVFCAAAGPSMIGALVAHIGSYPIAISLILGDLHPWHSVRRAGSRDSRQDVTRLRRPPLVED